MGGLMSIAKKLFLMVAVGLAALLFVTAYSWHTAQAIDEGYKEIIRYDYRQVELAMEALDHLGRAVQAYKNSLIRKDPKYVGEFQQECALIESNLKECAKFTDEDERVLVDK